MKILLDGHEILKLEAPDTKRREAPLRLPIEVGWDPVALDGRQKGVAPLAADASSVLVNLNWKINDERWWKHVQVLRTHFHVVIGLVETWITQTLGQKNIVSCPMQAGTCRQLQLFAWDPPFGVLLGPKIVWNELKSIHLRDWCAAGDMILCVVLVRPRHAANFQICGNSMFEELVTSCRTVMELLDECRQRQWDGLIGKLSAMEAARGFPTKIFKMFQDLSPHFSNRATQSFFEAGDSSRKLPDSCQTTRPGQWGLDLRNTMGFAFEMSSDQRTTERTSSWRLGYLGSLEGKTMKNMYQWNTQKFCKTQVGLMSFDSIICFVLFHRSRTHSPVTHSPVVPRHWGIHCRHLQCMELEAFFITCSLMPFQRRWDTSCIAGVPMGGGHWVLQVALPNLRPWLAAKAAGKMWTYEVWMAPDWKVQKKWCSLNSRSFERSSGWIDLAWLSLSWFA